MSDAILWAGAALLLAAALGALLAARRLYRSLRSIVIEIYKRLEAIERQAAAIRGELGGPSAPHTIEALLHRLHFVGRVSNFHDNATVREHLAALAEARVPAPAISYALARVVRSVEPLVIERGRSRTVICSLALGRDYFEKVCPALTSQQYYAEAHGLSYALLTEPPAFMERPPAWMKIPLIMHLFERGFDRVVYIDADALVTSLEFDVDAVFGARNPNGGIRLTEDEGGINTGVMLLEDGPATRRILDLTWLYDADIHHGTWEQFALKTLLDDSPAVRRHVAIEPDPRRFNSFPAERNRFHKTMERSRWRPGDFVCHFSGIRSPELERLLERYATGIAPLRYYEHAAE